MTIEFNIKVPVEGLIHIMVYKFAHNTNMYVTDEDVSTVSQQFIIIINNNTKHNDCIQNSIIKYTWQSKKIRYSCPNMLTHQTIILAQRRVNDDNSNGQLHPQIYTNTR